MELLNSDLYTVIANYLDYDSLVIYSNEIKDINWYTLIFDNYKEFIVTSKPSMSIRNYNYKNIYLGLLCYNESIYFRVHIYTNAYKFPIKLIDNNNIHEYLLLNNLIHVDHHYIIKTNNLRIVKSQRLQHNYKFVNQCVLNRSYHILEYVLQKGSFKWKPFRNNIKYVFSNTYYYYNDISIESYIKLIDLLLKYVPKIINELAYVLIRYDIQSKTFDYFIKFKIITKELLINMLTWANTSNNFYIKFIKIIEYHKDLLKEEIPRLYMTYENLNTTRVMPHIGNLKIYDYLYDLLH